jgi:polyhydroxyalkanoate synthesis regulator phasin
MAGDDLFKRYLEIGASVLGMSRERAEGIVRDLVASGEVAKGQATKAADWLVERGRAGSEEVTELIRREIRQQITALGLATQEHILRLQAQIDELKAATTAGEAAPKPSARAAKAPAGAETRKAAAASARKAAGTTSRKAAAKPSAGTAKAPAGDPAAPQTGTKAAGVTRSAPRKRSGADAPPAGGPDPSKG